MTYLRDYKNSVELKEAFSPAARTATANGSGVDMVHGDGQCHAILCVGTTTGTSPTLDVKFQESDSASSGYSDIAGATFAQKTAASAPEAIIFQRTKRYLRAVATIGGTSPSFTFGCVVGEQRKLVG